jgi:hypothetical protein
MLKPNLSPFASADLGAKMYQTFAFALVTGAPLIVGDTFVAACAGTFATSNPKPIATKTRCKNCMDTCRKFGD